jgi:hypothetical protein
MAAGTKQGNYLERWIVDGVFLIALLVRERVLVLSSVPHELGLIGGEHLDIARAYDGL